ncbi:hypothetical protein GCM10010121_078100 [Streptomyces brasiliensis]|uniref:Uncharacterized protein n=1 Tax=Streptomyces brasiliensis TaxID=1954 RepID=A0A917LD00_9ACTN|nr:hypothetical protein GCM10010121_078100 [Streptomyces brasiliensis]
MRECADGACTPRPSGRFRRPGLYDGPAEVFSPPPREQRYAVHQTAGDLESPFPPKSVQPGGEDPGCLHAECRDRAETWACRFVRLYGVSSRKAVREITGEETEPSVPGSAEYGIEL